MRRFSQLHLPKMRAVLGEVYSRSTTAPSPPADDSSQTRTLVHLAKHRGTRGGTAPGGGGRYLSTSRYLGGCYLGGSLYLSGRPLPSPASSLAAPRRRGGPPVL